jgi:hypothetical protein
LLRIDTLIAEDYFDPNDMDSQIYFTSQEIYNVIGSNYQYVKNYLVPVNGALYKHIKQNSTVTTFYGVYPNETGVDWTYAKEPPFERLIYDSERFGIPKSEFYIPNVEDLTTTQLLWRDYRMIIRYVERYPSNFDSMSIDTKLMFYGLHM